ncbi:MAG: DUF2955 domain-containing protein [Luteimonas sp.]
MSATAASFQAAAAGAATRHATLRFATGVMIAFVLCEAMQWLPSFLGPLLTVALLANLPMRPPLKMSCALIVMMALAAMFAFVLASFLRYTPTVLFGEIALTMFIAFHAIASGRSSLPFMLLLICVATIPVIVMIAPAQAGAFPMAMVRGMAVAVLVIAIVYVPWAIAPPSMPAPQARSAGVPPLTLALLSTGVMMPLVLAYLMLGLADALPVIITTVLLVINFDVRRGRAQATTMILGNLVGGVLALVLHAMLMVMPNLWVLSALLFVVLLGFGRRIVAGGPTAAVAVITCNSMLIILSLTLATGSGSASVWLTRLFQFVLAGAFAVGMMSLVSPRTSVQAVTS